MPIEPTGYGDLNLRSPFVRNMVLLVLITAGAIASVFLIGAYNAVEDLSLHTVA